MSERKFNKPNLIIAILLLLAGSAYLLFLHGMFPKLVPFHGDGEGFWLGEANNFTNETVGLYRDGNYVCDCSYYEFVIESGDEASILLKSNSPVNGMFTARQEIPLEKHLLAFIMLLAGIIGLALSIARRSIQ